jgi:hypothetical protein
MCWNSVDRVRAEDDGKCQIAISRGREKEKMPHGKDEISVVHKRL